MIPTRPAGRRAARALAGAFIVLLPGASAALAQTPEAAASSAPLVLTLDEALAMAQKGSEQVTIAASGVAQAEAAQAIVRSQRLPQLFGSASYDRAFRSEFEGLFDATGGGESCEPLQVNPAASLEDRVRELERAYDCRPAGGLFGGGDEGEVPDLPFGRANTWRTGLAFSQLLFAGGRVRAEERQAGLIKDTAALGLDAARAQTAFDVSQAFYDAALADRLVSIAQASYDQAARILDQTTAWYEAGRVSEFELLRARVARDSLEPPIVRARANRDVAYLRLKQLLDLPLGAPLQLRADLDDAGLPAPQPFADAVAAVEAAAEATLERVAIEQAEKDVQIAREDVRIARAARLPTVSLRSDYGLVSYANAPFESWRTNWTAGVTLSVPIVDGGRIKASTAAARAAVEEAEARLRLTRELAALDAERARQEFLAARAEWLASGGPIQQAQRAYEIAELRYREGLSTQLELSDSRLLLAQSQATRARAARELQVQRIRMALLPDLPLGSGTGAAGVGTAAGTAPQDQSVAEQPASARAGAAAATGTSATGGR